MDHDFRKNNNRTNQPPSPPYTSQSHMYNRPPSSSSSSSSSNHPMYGPPPPSSLYPKVGQHPVNPPPPFHPAPSPPSSGIGIRVRLKPEFRITPPPQLLPIEDVPQSTFQFDFDFERKILAEAEKETPDWSKLRLENYPSRPVEPTSSVSPITDPVLSKYLASGLSREAVPLAVAHYGDNPTKVREFGMAYTHLREMGFRSRNVAEALLMYDNDTDKALAYLLNN